MSYRPTTRSSAAPTSVIARTVDGFPAASCQRLHTANNRAGAPTVAAMLVASYSERPDLAARTGEIEDVWPEFIHHASINEVYWPRLREEFPDFQLVLYDDEADVLLGRGQTVPFRREGSWDELPDGVEGVLRQAFDVG